MIHFSSWNTFTARTREKRIHADTYRFGVLQLLTPRSRPDSNLRPFELTVCRFFTALRTILLIVLQLKEVFKVHDLQIITRLLGGFNNLLNMYDKYP